MGLVGDLLDAATRIIPGPIDDIALAAGRGIARAVRGGGGGRQRRSASRGRGVRRRPGQGSALVPTNGDDPPFIESSPIDFGPVQVNPGALMGRGDDNGNGQQMQPQAPMQGGGFMNDMAMKLIFQTMGDSSTGRALVEALTSGSLEGGIIQNTVTVNTPRGSENHSPPGFRTVYVNDQPYAVFKPFAKSLGLLKNESGLTFRQKLDKQTRQYMKNRKFIKDVAKKVGLKTENRKSGPSR